MIRVKKRPCCQKLLDWLCIRLPGCSGLAAAAPAGIAPIVLELRLRVIRGGAGSDAHCAR